MESYGAFNKDAEETMQFVGGIKYPDNFDGMRSEFICNFRRRISVANIKGNVGMYRKLLRSCLPGTGAEVAD
jgi:hypothetical protein